GIDGDVDSRARLGGLQGPQRRGRTGGRAAAPSQDRAAGRGPGLGTRAGPGPGAGAGLFGGLDRDALASIGIDIDAVRARIEASFGPQALTTASQALYWETPGLGRSRSSRWPAPVRHLRRRRARRALTASRGPGPQEAGPRGPRQAPGPLPGAHLPFTPIAKKILELALREALALHDSHIGVEHIALALVSVKRGLVPSVMSAADAPEPALRAAILERYQQAS